MILSVTLVMIISQQNLCDTFYSFNTFWSGVMITNTIVIVIVIIVIADGDRAGRDWVRGEPWVVGVPALDTSFHSSW